MSKRADELKAAMVRKAAERAASEEVSDAEFEEIDAPTDEDPEFLGEEEPDYAPVIDESYDAALEEDELQYEAQAAVAQEAGFDAFLSGQEIEVNPFLKDEDGILEDLEQEERDVLVEGWTAGWTEAYRESWTAEVLLGAKKLVETGDGDEAMALLERLTEAVGVLAEVLDFEGYEEFWGFESE